MPGIPSGPLLVVSPHLDDAVLSCSAVLERSEPVDVLTIFTGAPEPPQTGWWDEECGFSSSAESVPARLREDEAAFSGTPHRRHYLSLVEMQYVGRPRVDGDAHTIATSIRSWVSEHQSGTVAVPAGAGCASTAIVLRLRRFLRRPCHPPQHPDHLYVRDAVLPVVARAQDLRLLLYEELPYLFGAGADKEARRIAAGGWRADRIVAPVDRNAKAARIGAYSSQVPHISPPEGRLDEAATLPAHERYWLLRRESTSE